MPKKESQKVKGCRKCGRTAKKKANSGTPISLYVRDKISAKEYFNLIGVAVKG